jgi:purine catabolism regulator
LEAGDLVLLSRDGLRTLDERLTMDYVVTSLASRRVSSVAVVGKISESACRAARKHALCLFQMPETTDLRTVEHDVLRLLVEQEAQLDRRGKEVYRQLAQVSIENRGLPAIAEGLHQIVQKPVVIQDSDYSVLAVAPKTAGTRVPIDSDVDGSTAPARAHWLPEGPLDGKAPPCAVFSIEGTDRACCAAAIVVDGQLGGFVSILGAAGALDELDRLAAERGALVCAVELSKQRAVAQAEQRLRGNFLNALLTAGAAEESALSRRAEEMGYRFGGSHLVVLVTASTDTNSVDPLSLRQMISRELLVQGIYASIRNLVCAREQGMAILINAEDRVLLDDLHRQMPQRIRRAIQSASDVRITVGIGQPGEGLAGLRRSFVQAEETLALALDLFECSKVLAYGDLALYHLLQNLRGDPELRAFYQRTLAPLVAYDAEHNGELVATLDAFFVHHGNVSQTAESLHLHRNSLMYRLDRIVEITAHDLDSADDRFALQLALRLRPILTGM